MKPPADLHPDDTAARDDLRQTFIAYRAQQGITQRALAARLHIDPSAACQLEQQRTWRLSTLQRWATALDLEVVLTPAGLPEPPDDVRMLAAIRPASPGRRHEFDRAAILAELVAARQALGLTQTDLAQRLGCNDRAVSAVENPDGDVMVITLQRYCRALGGALQLDLALSAACATTGAAA